MSMIKVENLTFAYPGSFDNVFENVSFQIDTDWKLGFVGRNGRGKTTFLRLLTGEYPFRGNIHTAVKFDYFPKTVADETKLTQEILAEVCPLAEDWEIQREFSFLKVDANVLWRTFATLSQGERMKVLLAAMFLNEGRLLLIDEPTNHLDTDARKLVAAYLKKKKGFILVSQDRAFLDGCVDHILSLNRRNVEVQSGNFSSWQENFERQQSFERTQNERLQKDIGRLKESAKRSSDWSEKAESAKYGAKNSGLRPDRGYIGHKAAKMMQSAKNTEARRERALAEKSTLLKNAEYAENLKIEPLEYRAERLVTFSEVSICYDGREIGMPVSFSVERGERVLLYGGNGSGKSSLLKLLLGQRISHSGTLTIGSGLLISYVSQDTSFLQGKLSDFAKESKIEESLFKAILHKMDFSPEQFEKDIKDFSGGQKKKVLLARSLCERAHLYVWDEPLNFVDVYSREQIERLLLAFQPTMLFVEHDIAFQDAVATKIIRL